MKPYYQDDWVTLYYGNCLEILSILPDASAIVTDPPYELGFMGKSWDSKGVSFQKETWEAVRTACLSGAPLLSFGGSRTFHRIACAIEDAGWEIRDTVMWVYGSGFPKSLDISKAIDYDACREQLTEKLGRKPTKDELKEAWKEFRQVTGISRAGFGNRNGKTDLEGSVFLNSLPEELKHIPITTPLTPEAKLWEGYGTALKPAYEPIILAMNPLDGTFANNALKHGVAGLNIDECRIEGEKGNGVWGTSNATINTDRKFNASPTMTEYRSEQHPQGRFPANFIHDGSQMVMALFPETKSRGHFNSKVNMKGHTLYEGGFNDFEQEDRVLNDNGSAARFFQSCGLSETELLICRAKAIMEVWKQSYASIVDIPSILSSQAAVSALNHAVIVASQGGRQLSDAQGLSTNVMPSELNRICETLIIATLWCGSEQSLGQRLDELIPNGSRVRFVETQEQTDTMKIMISHWKSDGSAEPAMFTIMPTYMEAGAKGLSRLKYCAKASKAERDRGLENMPTVTKQNPMRSANGTGEKNFVGGFPDIQAKNTHPTVKPLALMEYLVKLVKMPEYNLIIDPFCGSGTTLKACIKLGIPCIGVDSDEHSCEIAARRCVQAEIELQQGGMKC